MKLRPEHNDKLKQLLDENACTSPTFILDLTAFIQDICDEAYEAGHYHRDQRSSPNYGSLSAWARYPDELKRMPEGAELLDNIHREISESKSSDLPTTSAQITIENAVIKVDKPITELRADK